VDVAFSVGQYTMVSTFLSTFGVRNVTGAGCQTGRRMFVAGPELRRVELGDASRVTSTIERRTEPYVDDAQRQSLGQHALTE